MAIPDHQHYTYPDENSDRDDELDEDSDSDSDEENHESMTRQLAETATSVREISKQLGRTRIKTAIQSVLIITKARDNHLIRFGFPLLCFPFLLFLN
jgi:NAD+ kinase